MNRTSSIISIFAAGALLLLGVDAAQAGASVASLTRSSLTNVTDAAGTYQQEGGTFTSGRNSTVLGTYVATRRVTNGGTDSFNTAATSYTLFFTPRTRGGVPENMTIQGAWSFNTGGFAGSVSAASVVYHKFISADASATSTSGATVITLEYIGPSDPLP